MSNLSRSAGLKIAAVILLAQALIGMFTVGIPFLVGGSGGSATGIFFFVAVVSFAVDSLSILAAYGLWRAERWAVILAIIFSVFNAILNTGGALGDSRAWVQVMAATFVVTSLITLFLCLRRGPQFLSKAA